SDPDKATEAAEKGFQYDSSWRKLDPAAHAQLIHKLADSLLRVVDYLAAGFPPDIVNSVSVNTHHQNENNSYNDIHIHTQLETILECIQSGKKVGDKGNFIRPTIFTNVKDDMKVAREESTHRMYSATASKFLSTLQSESLGE
ncbi:unnamed protein product, partial [Rotaria sordida]